LKSYKIYRSDYALVCNDSFDIIKDACIVFDKNIIDIDTFENISKKYPNENIDYQGTNSVIMPGLINPHVHLEFSKNKTTLEYGNFISWLNSVIANREELIEGVDSKFLQIVLKKILKTGTTCIGAVSSYGFEFDACKKSPVKTVIFSEVIGSKAAMCDMLFDDFSQRVEQSIKLKDDKFIPAIAIHSPYSVHPILIKRALQKANDNDFVVSAHFMESSDEKEWLYKSSGNFKPFFENFLNQSNSLQTPEEFLNIFDNTKNCSFVHSVNASKEHLEKIKSKNHSIITCPVSNRVLTNSKLNIDNCDNINLAIATDGLSSNFSLSMFDELRSALMIHENKEPNDFAKELLKMATINGAKVLNLNNGSLETNKSADFLVCDFDSLLNENSIALMTILHTKYPKKVLIDGVEF
jgi:cytosine/adenosine deaminase-related metal-dependent hydrolase